MDEDKLIGLAKMGQSEAVGQLYDMYVEPIYRFFYWQTNYQKQEAEDLTHDTFIQMAKSLKGFKHRASFKNWLYAIAKNQLKHWLRRKYRMASQPLFESISDTAEWIDPKDQEKKVARVDRLLGDLANVEQQVIRLRYLKNYSVAETAKELRLNSGNVKVIAHRAMKKLQNKDVT